MWSSPVCHPGAVPWGTALVQALMDTVEDAVLGLDAAGRVTIWNAAATRIFGFRDQEVVGGSVTELFAPHVRRELAALFAGAAHGEGVSRFETEIRRRDGLPIPITLSMRPVFDAERRFVATVVVVRDITEQRLAQARLAEMEERIAESEALAHVGSWLWDVRTGVVQWSDEFHRIHGIDPLEFDGTLRAHLAVIHPEDRGRIHKAMHQAVVGSRPFEDTYRVVRADGEVRRVHARAEPAVGSADSADAALGLRGIGQDVTECV
jgi:HTH-type transcriptional regulator, bacterioopsin transcriptional activator and related proteins